MSLTETIKVRSPFVRPTTIQQFEQSVASWKKSAMAQQSWSLRLSKEYLCSVCTIFVTLTFDDAHLKYFYFNPDLKWDCKCFDNLGFREDLIRSLRQVDGYSFRYVAFPEYGKDEEYLDYRGKKRKGTMRPHLHVLFFFDYDVDPGIFKNAVYNRWHRCDFQCLDVVKVNTDEGFTRYVSKYVSKGFNEHLPQDLIERVNHYRKELQQLNNVPRGTIEKRKFNYQFMAHFLNWYENHRPKLLCSNGIGNVDWSEKELLDGKTLLFNGKKFESIPLSPYVKRKHYFDRKKDYAKTIYKRSGDFLFIYDSPVIKVKYNWELNDFGREALLHQLPERISNCRDWIVKVQLLQGVIPFDAIDYYNKMNPSRLPLEYGVKYEDIRTLSLDMDLLVCTKLFYSRYDVEHLSNCLGFDILQLSTDELVRNWTQFYECLVKSPSNTELYERSPKDVVTICDINPDFYNAELAIGCLMEINEISQYCDYLRRKKERDERKELKHSKIDLFKRY